MPTVQLSAGRIDYEEHGPSGGRPVVCVHGVFVGGDLWSGLAERLGRLGLRCIVPTWPLGAHREPLNPGADRSPRGVAAMIAEFMAALDLQDVVLFGSDSGGALSQVVAVDHPERLGALVLTNCDAFERFPPPPFQGLVLAARSPVVFRLAMIALLSRPAIRRSPLVFGLLSHVDFDHLSAGWVRRLLGDRRILEDLRVLAAAIKPEVTLDAARRLPGFDRPVLLPWGADDRLFPLREAHRLAAVLPDARVVPIARSRAFTMIDQPDRLAELVGDFALNPVRSG